MAVIDRKSARSTERTAELTYLPVSALAVGFVWVCHLLAAIAPVMLALGLGM